MQNIDINKLDSIKEELSKLTDDDTLFVTENGKTKYAIITERLYDVFECYRASVDEGDIGDQNVKMFVDGLTDGISYDEYETLRKQLIDVFDKTFKPKADKLN